MDIRPYYTDELGQANVQAEPARVAGWTGAKVTNGLMLSRPLNGVGTDWSERPETKGQPQTGEAPAGLVPLQV